MAGPSWMNGLRKAAHGFYGLPAVRQLSLLIGLSVSVALGVAVVLWSQTPDFSPLYAHLDSQTTGDVVDALDHAGIEYKIENRTGSVLVPKDKIYAARIKLAQSGLPKNSSIGFEMLSKDQNIGASRFIETARYWHALEGELARTISSFSSVRNARVHLAVPKSSVLLNDIRKPSASVLVDLASGGQLEKEQVDAIEQLVASSVQGLSSKAVTVVDSQGRLLSDHDSPGMNRTRTEFEYQRNLERSYAKHIEEILSPMLGANKVRAQVAADIDFTSFERTEEKYLPKEAAVRSERTLDEKTSGNSASSGAPGAAANTPGGSSSGGGGQSKTGKQSSKNSTVRNFEVSRNVSHTSHPMGSIKRLTVAVVIDDKTAVNPETGKTERVKIKDEEIQKIKELVQSAVGYNQQRGDTVSVVNSSFAQPEKLAPPEDPPIWNQHWFWNVMKSVAAGLFILIMVFMVLKPVLSNLSSKAEDSEGQPKVLAANGPDYILDDNVDPNAQITISAGELNRLQQQGQWTKLKKMASDDPKRIAQVMRTWVGDE